MAGMALTIRTEGARVDSSSRKTEASVISVIPFKGTPSQEEHKIITPLNYLWGDGARSAGPKKCGGGGGVRPWPQSG